jgi:fumarate reductase subunit D
VKRSHAPIFWLLFGAGGMLAALIGAALVFISGIAAPQGWLLPRGWLDYERALGFAYHGAGKLFLFGLIALFLWHAAHRIFHSLHDLGVHAGWPMRLACYGGAFAASIVALVTLWRIGF